MHCFTWCMLWKPNRWIFNKVWYGNLCFTSFLWRENNQNCFSAKNNSAVDPCTVNKYLKKLQEPQRSGIERQAYFETVILAIEANAVSSTPRVSGEVGIWQFCVIDPFHNLGKIIGSCRVVLHVTKILQNKSYLTSWGLKIWTDRRV